jgi:hypothetical protein
MSRRPASLDDIEPETPIRLALAARLAYPDGSMSASGLRRLGEKGLLVIERVNRRDYTTLAAIRQMREECRVAPKAPAYGSASVGVIGTGKRMVPSTSSLIADAKSQLDALLTKPKPQNGRSQTTSRKSINAK